MDSLVNTFFKVFSKKVKKHVSQLQFVGAFVLKVSRSYAVRGSRGSTFSVSAKTSLPASLELSS